MADNTQRVEEVLRHSRALRSEAEALFQELREAGTDLAQVADLRGRMERHPYLTVAAAMGLGYVLGGGLFTRLTGRLLSLGTRLVVLPMVRAQLESFAAGPAEPPPGYAASEDGLGGL